MAKGHWLVKQEPSDYSWTKFVADRQTAWTGVRNFQARNYLRAMKRGDQVLYYHSGEAKEVIGMARVVKTAYVDPTAAEGDWSAVDLAPVEALKRPVPLAVIKSDPAFGDLLLIRNSRLSVLPMSAAQFARIIGLSGSDLTRTETKS